MESINAIKFWVGLAMAVCLACVGSLVSVIGASAIIVAIASMMRSMPEDEIKSITGYNMISKVVPDGFMVEDDDELS